MIEGLDVAQTAITPNREITMSQNTFQTTPAGGTDAAGHPELIRIGPGGRMGTRGVAIDPRHIQLRVMDARAVGILTWLLLRRRTDGNLLWYPEGSFVRLDAQGSLFSEAGDGTSTLIEYLKVLDQWIRLWTASVVAQQEPPDLPPELADIGREQLEEAMLDISWTRARRLSIGSEPAGPYTLVVPPRSQLVRCGGTSNPTGDQDGALVRGLTRLTELVNPVGTVCYIQSNHVAKGIAVGTKVRLIRAHGPSTKGWRRAGLIRLPPPR